MADDWAGKVSRLLGDRGPDLYRIAFALTGTDSAAQGLLGTGLARALKASTRTTSPEELAVFARRAVYSAFLDREKSPSKPRRGAREPEKPSDPFLAALDVLTAQQRLCLVMRFYEGLSCAAIARDLDVLPPSIRKCLDAAIEALGRPLPSLGLTTEEVHYGGWTPGENGSASQQAAQDTLSMGFTRIDDLASAAYKHVVSSKDRSPLVDDATRHRRSRAWTIAGLSTLATLSLGVAGWTAVRAFAPVSEPAASPSPGPSSIYGMGVLASDDVLEGASSWAGHSNVQRLLVCDPSTEEDNPFAQDDSPLLQGFDPSVEYTTGGCSQQFTDAASFSATVAPYRGSAGLTSLRVLVTLTNTGTEPIAVIRNSLALHFELPWGWLSFLPAYDQVQIYLVGSTVNDRRLWYLAVDSDAVLVVQPGEDLVVTIDSWVVPDTAIIDYLEGAGIEATEEAQQEIRGYVSLVGERSDRDPILGAFASGDYAPRAGVALTVAPSDPTSDRQVVLWFVQDRIGEVPDPEPSSSPSSSPTSSAAAGD